MLARIRNILLIIAALITTAHLTRDNSATYAVVTIIIGIACIIEGLQLASECSEFMEECRNFKNRLQPKAKGS